MFNKFERTIAWRYLRSSSSKESFIALNSLFSFLGIMLGVATLIIVLAVMNGFRQELLSQIIGINGHIGVYQNNSPLQNYDKLAKKVEKIEGVNQVLPIVQEQAIVTFNGRATGVIVKGVAGKDLNKLPLLGQKIVEGDIEFHKAGAKPDTVSNTIMIGRRLAEQAGLQVGDRITLITPRGDTSAFGVLPKQRVFKISAIFELGMYEYDNSMVFVLLDAAQHLFNYDNTVTNLEIFSSNLDQSHKTAALIEQTLGEPYQILDWQHKDSRYFQAVQVERNVMFVILTLIILIAAFNIISGLIMLVKDKTKSIGILRTMGASSQSIVKIFFLTGASIGLTGTLLGVILGLSFALNIESIRQFLQSLSGVDLFSAEIYFLSKLPAKVDWSEVFMIVLMSLGFSFGATIYPAFKAGKLDPIEALKQ